MLSLAEYEEVLQMRREFAALRADWERTVRDYYARKFDPEQPRKPPGPGGGRWTSGDTSSTTELSAARKRSAAWCWNQMHIDMLLCSTLPLATQQAICRHQAMERYAACIVGRPLPPLSY